MWMEKKRLNKQILFLNPHHHHHLLCLASSLISFHSPNEWDVFGVTQPPCTSWLMVVGDWFIIFFTHYIGLPGRHTRFPVGTMFPIQWRTIWKSLLRVRFFFYLDDVLHGIVIKFCIWVDDNFNWGFTGGFRIQERPTSASWIVCRKARDFIIVTGAKSSTVRDVMNKKVPTFAYPANVW